MEQYYQNQPTYDQLDNYKRCVIENLTSNLLIKQLHETRRPKTEDWNQSYINLRDVLLAVGGIEPIIEDLRDMDNANHYILTNCIINTGNSALRH